MCGCVDGGERGHEPTVAHTRRDPPGKSWSYCSRRPVPLRPLVWLGDGSLRLSAWGRGRSVRSGTVQPRARPSPGGSAATVSVSSPSWQRDCGGRAAFGPGRLVVRLLLFVLAFAFITYLVEEIPLINYALPPEGTASRVEELSAWLGRTRSKLSPQWQGSSALSPSARV